MFNLIAIGDPIVDTHIQISDNCSECRVLKRDQEHLCLDYGRKIPIVDSFQCLGGNAPNVAVAAAKLGLKTTVVSTVGGDANGKVIVDDLKRHGVNPDYVTVDKNSKTRYSIILNYRKERTILSYTDKKKYQWPGKLPATDWVYYTGLSKGYETVQKKLRKFLDQHPTVRLAVNPGSYFLKYAIADLRAVVNRADVLIVNLEEAERVAGTALARVKTMRALANKLLWLGTKEVVITDSARGAWAATHKELYKQLPYPVKIVAKTGAGDAFSAGYLTARQSGLDLSDALQWGTANSCSVIKEHGSLEGLANKKGIVKMIKQFPKIKPKKIM